LVDNEEMARIRNYLDAWAWTVGTETPDGVPLAKQLLAHADALQAALDHEYMMRARWAERAEAAEARLRVLESEGGT